MKTIEQRAEEFAEREYYEGSYERERIAFGYYHGAIEQHKIDIEKATEWMKIAFAPVAHHYQCGIDGLVEEFKRAMEL